MVSINEMEYPVVFIKNRKTVTARCVTLPIVTQGENQEEARKLVVEAIQLYLETEEENEQPDIASFSYGIVEVPVRFRSNKKISV